MNTTLTEKKFSMEKDLDLFYTVKITCSNITVSYYQPQSLFNIALDFVALNAENIQSLDKFPEIVGENIFKRFLWFKNKGFFPEQASEEIFPKIFQTFVNAYEHNILDTLNLSHSLIVVNEYFSSLSVLMSPVTELCLCSCLLGNNHELMDQIPLLINLKKLCLRKNFLKSDVIRKISIPFRMFDRGPKYLEYLDLSDNPVTDEIASWLLVFKNLKWLNLSDTGLTRDGINIFTKSGFSLLHSNEDAIHPIVTKGWAAEIVLTWQNICIKRTKHRTTLKTHRHSHLNECTHYSCGHLILHKGLSVNS